MIIKWLTIKEEKTDIGKTTVSVACIKRRQLLKMVGLTECQYKTRKHLFPAPAYHIGKSDYWTMDQAKELKVTIAETLKEEKELAKLPTFSQAAKQLGLNRVVLEFHIRLGNVEPPKYRTGHVVRFTADQMANMKAFFRQRRKAKEELVQFWPYVKKLGGNSYQQLQFSKSGLLPEPVITGKGKKSKYYKAKDVKEAWKKFKSLSLRDRK